MEVAYSKGVEKNIYFRMFTEGVGDSVKYISIRRMSAQANGK